MCIVLQHMKMLLIPISPVPCCCCFGRPADAPQRTRRSTRAGRLPHLDRLPCPNAPKPLSRRPRSPRSAKKRIHFEKTIYNKLRDHKKGFKGGLNFYVPPKMRRVSERRRFPIKSVIPNVRLAVVTQASTVNLL